MERGFKTSATTVTIDFRRKRVVLNVQILHLVMSRSACEDSVNFVALTFDLGLQALLKSVHLKSENQMSLNPKYQKPSLIAYGVLTGRTSSGNTKQ